MYYLLFSVHELSDDETRPDAHSVTTEVETVQGNYTVNVRHLLKDQAACFL